MLAEFGELGEQAGRIGFEKGLLSPYDNTLNNTMLDSSNLDTQMKQWLEDIKSLCPDHMVDGDFPMDIWVFIIIRFSLGPIAIKISAEQMALSRGHPVQVDWIQHYDQSRVGFAWARDALYNCDLSRMVLWMDPHGRRVLTIDPVDLPRCSPIFYVETNRYKDYSILWCYWYVIC